jgi:polar amino acid transport system substrate-binding protein
MKVLLRILATILISVTLSWIMLNNFGDKGASSKQKQETAYDRVIRTKTLRCGYFIWPPFFQKDAKTGELSGLLKDVIDRMTSTMDLKVEYIESVLGQQPQDLKTGKYDSFCFDSFLMPKTSKYIDYTKPWGYIGQYAYGLKTTNSVATLQDFNSDYYKFTALDGDSSMDLAVRFFPQAELLSHPNTTDPSLLLLDLVDGKANAFITDEMTIIKFEKTNGDQIKRLYDHPLVMYPINFSVKKGEVGLQNLLNYAVDIFVYTNNYNEILDRYDPEKVITRIDTQRN